MVASIIHLAHRSCAFVWILFTCFCGNSQIAVGVPIAADTASESAYLADPTGAWKGLNSTPGENPVGNDNGGFGFDLWNFAGGFHDPAWSPYGELNHFIDGVDFVSSSFNDLGSPSFGLTNANRPFFGYTARATRTFAPLGIGDTLSIDFDNPLLQPLDPFSSAGFLFRLNTGGGPVIDDAPIPGVQERFGIFTTSNFNSGHWYVTDSENFTDTGIADSGTASGATFRFSLTGMDTYSMEFVRLSDSQILFARTGLLRNVGAGAIDSLEITLFGNGSGSGPQSDVPSGQREFFFNNLLITSQQSSMTADFDMDGDVDGRDFLVWQRGGSPNPLSSGDLTLWQAQYSASLSATATAVPEPGAAILFMLAFLFFTIWFRKRVAVEITVLALVVTALVSPATAVDKFYVINFSGTWHLASNWNPSGIPTTSDRVFIDNGLDIRLTSDTAPVEHLNLSNGGEIRTSGFKLLVDGGASNTTTDIFAGSRILVTPRTAGGAAFDTDSLTIHMGGCSTWQAARSLSTIP